MDVKRMRGLPWSLPGAPNTHLRPKLLDPAELGANTSQGSTFLRLFFAATDDRAELATASNRRRLYRPLRVGSSAERRTAERISSARARTRARRASADSGANGVAAGAPSSA